MWLWQLQQIYGRTNLSVVASLLQLHIDGYSQSHREAASASKQWFSMGTVYQDCRLQFLGSEVRHRPDAINFQTAEAARAIYDSKSNVRKSKQYQLWPRHTTAQTTFSLIDKSAHARRRRVLDNVFSDKALRSAEDVAIRHISRWFELLLSDEHSGQETQWTKSKDMKQWFGYLILDMISELCLGQSFETKEPGDNAKKTIPRGIVGYLDLLSLVSPGTRSFPGSSANELFRAGHLVSFPRNLALVENKGSRQIAPELL